MSETRPKLSAARLLAQLPQKGLFRHEGVPWLISPQPLQLPPKLRREIERLGPSLAKFQDSSQLLYQQSAKGKCHPWLAQCLDAGKESWLIDCQCTPAMRQRCPSILRPDLLWTDSGFALSELDSVPGGMGITHFLNKAYTQSGFEGIIGGANGICEGWHHAYPEGRHIAISEESSDYEGEMRYLAQELGPNFSCGKAEELDGHKETRSIYRFFELFDTAQIPAARALLERCAQGKLKLDPPPLPHLEEKAWLALFHCPSLQEWWQQNLRGSHRNSLQGLIPRSWLLDPTPLPPQASLPWLNLHSWYEVGLLSQRERRLVLKISGYNELAWGARGVFIGHDMAQKEWQAQINSALAAHPKQAWVMQEFREAKLIEHPYYHPETGEIHIMKGRVRLCPYYFRSSDGKSVQLGGCLATIVPADKKKIHGMKDAIIVPTC